MSIRDFGDLSLSEMREEFSRAAASIARNAYNRTRDTDAGLYQALWGDRVTAKGLEKELLDQAQENERTRYISAYQQLINKYSNAYTVENRDQTVALAKKVFTGSSSVEAVRKLRQQQKYLEDPKVKGILKTPGSNEGDDDTVMSDLILQYVSNDYKLAQAAGMSTAEVALLEKDFASAADFKNFLLERIALQEGELEEVKNNANARTLNEKEVNISKAEFNKIWGF